MTREAAIELPEERKKFNRTMQRGGEQSEGVTASGKAVTSASLAKQHKDEAEALDLALAAHRPVSREQVERIWFQEPYSRLETKQGDDGSIVYSAVNTCMACGHETPIGNFCHNCGVAQNREAVEMVIERLEALYDNP